MPDVRLSQLERDHRSLSNRVDGISRTCEKIKTTQETWKETMCNVHTDQLNEVQSELKSDALMIEDLKSKLGNKWPSLIASIIGGTLAMIPLVILFFTILLPAMKSIEAVARVNGG